MIYSVELLFRGKAFVAQKAFKNARKAVEWRDSLRKMASKLPVDKAAKTE